LFRVFGLSIPEKFENRWKNKLGSVALGWVRASAHQNLN
jgi:hypothetical protein